MNRVANIPEIQVGICSGSEISFALNSDFIDRTGKALRKGKYIASASGNKIIIRKDGLSLESDQDILLNPETEDTSSFTIHAVTIGVGFHWQRKEDQVFKGKIRIIRAEGKVTIVNIISVEDYLTSVISSEMKSTSSQELLKAHAVVSRSWLLAQIEKTNSLKSGSEKFNSATVSEDEIIRWYDREDHTDFDVCADDHCQRYQGITRASSDEVANAIGQTSGIVLKSNGSICDTRYYKCCGGVSELFENVWEPVSHYYLQKVIDNPGKPEGYNTDLEKEENARKWILGKPEAFCNTNDTGILSQVLNDYDLETGDFYRWKVKYTQSEISSLVRKRTGIDFGTITGLKPVERGVSGRIKKLKIEGTLKTMIIGKELEIRKSLSSSHLYSSCFVVEETIEDDERWFTLHGAGWGHGVGLCQIGAAVMGARGYSYREILLHYFRNAQLEKIY